MLYLINNASIFFQTRQSSTSPSNFEGKLKCFVYPMFPPVLFKFTSLPKVLNGRRLEFIMYPCERFKLYTLFNGVLSVRLTYLGSLLLEPRDITIIWSFLLLQTSAT